MRIEKLNFENTGLFSRLFLDYIGRKKELKAFYSLFPDEGNFIKQIELKQFDPVLRQSLSEVLQKQYESIHISPLLQQNLKLLQEANTYTITTGHQLNIFTGPLYFIYKIVTVINACKELCSKYPEYHFVPVYWMASEDHDFEEINHIHLLGNKYTWKCDRKGAVGRMNPHSLKDLLNDMPGDNGIFRKAYLEHDTLSDAVRYYINELFGEEGLVVIEPDDRTLKQSFRHMIKDELQNHTAFSLVEGQSEKLTSLGYKPKINPREINLFYLDDGIRERIVHENGKFKILNSELSFSETEILDLAENEPEKFSPNVILRPVYQECILPNLAYVGGPAEVVYWLQLKSVFDHYKIAFPILLPRNFALYIDHATFRKLRRTEADVPDIFVPVNELSDKLVEKTSDNKLELHEERNTFSHLFDDLVAKAEAIDATLAPVVKAEANKTLKGLQKIEKKLLKAEKRHHDDQIGQIVAWKEKLFPGGTPQERTLNFLNFFIEDADFIRKIGDGLSPLDLRYHILIDEGE